MEKAAELKQEEIHPEPLLRGRDLIEQGFVPGPEFREILAHVEEAQLGGELCSREDALKWVKHNYGRRG
jgi:poly(A) polymerase